MTKLKLINNLMNKVRSSQTFKDIAVLASGSVIGYALNFIGLPIISRIYTPGELGEYDLIVSTSSFVSDIAALGLFLVIMLPAEEEMAKDICKIILVSNCVILGLLYLVCLGGSSLFQIFDISISYPIALTLFILYIFSFNIQMVFYSYVNRERLYRVMFWNPIFSAITNIGLSVTFGILGFGSLGYMIGTILSYLVCVVHMRRYVNPFDGQFDFGNIKRAITRYKNIPLVQMPSNLIQTAATQIPNQYLGRMFSTSILGGYTMATRLLYVPVSLLAGPVNRVYYRNLAQRIETNDKPGEFAFGLLEKNIKVAILPIAFFMLFGEYIVVLILGKDWSASGIYITILGIVFLLMYCSSCLSGTFVAAGRQKLSFLAACITLVANGVCFGISYALKLPVINTIIIYAIFAAADQIKNLALCMYCLNYPLINLWKFLVKYIGSCALVVYVIKYVWINFVIG